MAGLADIAKHAGVDKDTVSKVFEAIEHYNSRGEEVRLVGFGTFRRHTTKARTIRSPVLEGGVAHSKAHNTMKFKASAEMVSKLNSKDKSADRKKIGQRKSRTEE